MIQVQTQVQTNTETKGQAQSKSEYGSQSSRKTQISFSAGTDLTTEVLNIPTKKGLKNPSFENYSPPSATKIQSVPKKEEMTSTGERLSIGFFSEELLTVIQNGYRTKKEFQTADPDEEPKPLKISSVPLKSMGPALTSEEINTEKMTFRSGYQALGKENQQAEYDLLLKGVDFPTPITLEKMYGSQNGANGYNGIQKSNLYLATYLDPDGVGNRPK